MDSVTAISIVPVFMIDSVDLPDKVLAVEGDFRGEK